MAERSRVAPPRGAATLEERNARLWCCHTHEMVGGADEAIAHFHEEGKANVQRLAAGHAPKPACSMEYLSQEVSDGVRAYWAEVGDPRAS